MPGAVLSAAVSLRGALAVFVAEEYSVSDCARLAEELAATEKACAAARLLASCRAVAAGAHRERGFSDGAAWMARNSGGTGRQARRELTTAGGLEQCPETKSALLAGEVSLEQAAEIARSAEESPGLEGELLELARRGDLSQLRDRSRERQMAALDAEDLHRRQRRSRHFRHWRDGLGMVCFSGALAPSDGLPFLRRIELAASRGRRAAQEAGGPVGPFETYAADALVALTSSSSGEGPPRPDRSELVIVCDLNAWRRGHVHEGEPCHLVGGGPLPVEEARRLGEDAFVKAVLHDGVAIHSVKHFGRHLPAELRTALDLGPVPAFSGAQCARCGRRFGLEYDHVDPVAHRGPTSYGNLQALCWYDHRDKTERDRRAGLLGPRPP